MNNNNQNAGDQSLLRNLNLSAVLSELRQNKQISRAGLADVTGLNKATITRLVRELIDYGFVKEVGLLSTLSTGRPSILLELNPQAGFIIAARLDIDYNAVILTDFSGNIIWRNELAHTPEDGQTFILDNLLRLILEAVDQATYESKPILGLGLSVPGLVDIDNGTLLFAPNLGWRNFSFKDWLGNHFNLPIYINNEANLAALGESFLGAARDSNYVLYINITSGVGAGIVYNKEILSGVAGIAGEVGHMTIDPHGPKCNCGNLGCWEAFVSAPAILRRMRKRIKAGESSVVTEETLKYFSKHTISKLVDSAGLGDTLSRDILKETGEYIGLGLANLINVLNPERVVLGGYLSPAYPIMLEEIKTSVQARALEWAWRGADIVIAHFGSDASLMGAFTTIHDHVLSYPIETLARLGEGEQVERR
jgi:glucokinase-like ROK family protein